MALLILFFIEVPGIGKKSTTSVDENCQKLAESLSQHNSSESQHLKNSEVKSPTSRVVGLRDNVINPNLHDDDENGAGLSSIKESFTTLRSPSLHHTVQSLESHNCCRKYPLILLFIYLIFLIYSH